MPLVRIEIRTGKPVEYRQSLIGSVREAFFDALQIPEATLWIRLCERKEENFLIPPGRSDDAVLIEVSLIAGRSAEKKEALYRAIVEQLARDPGVSPDDVCIVVYEPPAENWAERAGISAARR
ncbi:MAG TPA: tautomerase family protein [Candidatus Methanoculleus thermohydrogenotrophicum]|jgi:phenylpyruvate tautomerase PptA (4-oxalocrotonate tautomerase family)|nr:tautomerase family protein [Candidatus Methanoculleus thermohydrogenotrophicum]NLM82446.1 tautomerase family protein [Candidatus Methanoculleus thermohydrogenotrophicum]HOB18490.1 tautomerase family protein [Candidatus Methanoculleus thermohydrogenotrophicum]HPZ38607.1 tautomerase family protein [Candidatus Methanoculleus thermohydrogenotrophicum]HQC91752.1 tautomerase family protein [Candidatus Methanoculleus thermohydrogenotrophicum]